MFAPRRRPLTGFAALVVGAALTLSAGPAAQAASSPPGMGRPLGTLTPSEVKAELRSLSEQQLATPMQESEPSCSEVAAGVAAPEAGPGTICTQVTTTPTRSFASADLPAHDDDDDEGSGADPVGTCSVQINTITYGRLSYCYNASVTSTFTNSKTGMVSLALWTVNGQATLKPKSGSWQEDDLITFISGTNLYAGGATVKFAASCSACSAIPMNPALATIGVPMVPGGSLLAGTLFSDAPAAGGVDYVAPSYSFNAQPPSGGIVISPATWALNHKVRCDKTMESNTVTGCVISDVKPIFKIPIDDKYGAAAATYFWASTKLKSRPGVDRALTRLDDKLVKKANRRRTCEDLSTVPFVHDNDLVPTDSCDEYPFAATYEGGTNGALCAEIVPQLKDGVWTIYTYDNARPVTLEEPCVRSHVPLKQNTDAGSKYSGFLSSQHVIDLEKFYVNAHF